MKKLGLLIATILILSLEATPTVLASEGLFELRNTQGGNARCHVTSVLLPNLNYRVLLSCRDVTYPGGAEIFNYSVWATKVEDGSAFYLGEVGVGKAEYATNIPFNSVFITSERAPKPRTPTGNVIMQGTLKANAFLDVPGVAQPITEDELEEASPVPTVAPEPEKKSAASRILAAGGVIAFICIYALLLVLFVITRK
jgi:hypothetical protein